VVTKTMALWFRRKKNEEPAVESVEEAKEAVVGPSKPAPAAAKRVTPAVPKDPVEALTSRLEAFLKDPATLEKTKVVKPTRIQLIVGGTALLLSKEGVKPIELSRERSVQSDAFIRMSEEAAGELAGITALPEFGKRYRELVRTKGAAAYITIKLQAGLDDLRLRGFFSVELLRILIDA
jgi:hypothetical protein